MSKHLICLALTSASMLLTAPITFAADTTSTTTQQTQVTTTPPPSTQATSSDTSTSSSIKNEITEYNKKLPTMIDNITQLTNISLEGDNIIYNLKVISYNSSELDAKKFEEKIRPSIMSGVCNDEKVTSMLKEGYSITYRYNGKDDKLISNIPISYTDCDTMNKNKTDSSVKSSTDTTTTTSTSTTTPSTATTGTTK